MNRRQRGSSLLIVLVLLTVLLLGALSMARMTESSSLLAGNIAFKDAALQASEVGVSEAFAAFTTLADPETNVDGWYFAAKGTDDSTGLPTGVTWANAAQVAVGKYQVAYVIERLCQGPMPVADSDVQCVLKQLPMAGSSKAGVEALASPAATQYRFTVSTTGPKQTQSFVQVMAIR